MTPRIMIVDDQEATRRLLREILAANAFEVVGEASNGDEAVLLFDVLRPDAITMDLVMPKMNGLEAARAILSQAPMTVIVPVSGLAHPSVQAASFDVGMKGFVAKPIDARELLGELREALSLEDAQ
ncbi:MAG: response regulator [Deltaproteobacteria bacterium]|nr:response regulator [Deltaproteobacteria bacterium]